jgi:hypothetical protein
LEHCAPAIAKRIKAAPANVKNISEYCKRQTCWAAVSALNLDLDVDLSHALIEERDIDVEFDARLRRLVPHAAAVRKFASSHWLLSPQSATALAKLTTGNLRLNRGETNSLKFLFTKMSEKGFKFPS